MFNNIANKLNYLMAREAISGMKLAQKLGIPASTLKKIRSQEITNPTLATLVPIAQYFSMPLEYFLEADYQCDLPLLDLTDVVSFPHVPSKSYVTTSRSYGRESFGLRIADEGLFPKNSFVIVDKTSKPSTNDFVIIIDDGNAVISQFKNKDTTIMGVIVEYHRELIVKHYIKE